jgi:opacity protein-like surface antigen
MVKKIILLAAVFVMGWLAVAQAQVWVDPYTRKDGTYVSGHYRSNPDGNPYNNWSYPGNVNPYTGKQATGDPNRYLERYNNQGNSGNGNGSSSTPIRFIGAKGVPHGVHHVVRRFVGAERQEETGLNGV